MRITAIILTIFLLFALVACGESETTSSQVEATSSSADVSTNSADESTTDESQATSEDNEISDEASAEVSDETSEEVSGEVSGEVSDEVSDEVSGETSEEDEEEEPVVYPPLKIKKTGTAPVVDGEVGSNEYTTSFEFDASKTYWNAGSIGNAEDYDVVLYMSWDDTYLYTAISLKVGMQRTYDNTDFLSNRPYIFDRRHVMSAIVTGNPTDPKYLPPEGNEWDWSAANNSGFGTEWTVTAQPDGTNIKADHFGKLTQNADFQYVVAVSKYDTEVYEQRIPWAALTGINSFTVEDGAIFGYSFSACCEEVSLEENEDEDSGEVYACFGDGIINGKNFSRYVGITLSDD